MFYHLLKIMHWLVRGLYTAKTGIDIMRLGFSPLCVRSLMYMIFCSDTAFLNLSHSGEVCTKCY